MPTAARRALRLMRDLLAIRPTTPDELHRFIERVVGVTVPRVPLLEDSDAPFDYLVHAFFEPAPGDATETPPPRDCVVWAGRGSGKTYLGALATMLDLCFKPGVRVHLLAGSLEQSSRMFEHLTALLTRPTLRPLLVADPTQRGARLVNGSAVRLLSHSHRSIRGARVHKLRCDEVEEMEPRLWEAAQLVTTTGDCGGTHVVGTVEALSTMHRPYGIMSRLVDRQRIRRFRWSALDVIERCPEARPCAACKLWPHCLGRAKHASGFVGVDEMIRRFERTSDDVWAAEMMCQRPAVRDQVFADFDPRPGGRHVLVADVGAGPHDLVAAVQTGRRDHDVAAMHGARLPAATAGDPYDLIAGLDLGLRNPLAMLWATVTVTPGVPVTEQRVVVVDEYCDEGLTLDEHLRRIETRGWPKPAWIGADPAGGQRSSQTGVSDITCLRRRGYHVRATRVTIRPSLEIIRRRFDRGTLRVAAHCSALIRALREYHYAPNRRADETPVKDGPDHLCDALRYLLVNLEFSHAPVQRRDY